VISGLRSLARRLSPARPDEIAAYPHVMAGERADAGAPSRVPLDADGRVDFDAVEADIAKVLARAPERATAVPGSRSLLLRLVFDPLGGHQRARVEVLGCYGEPTNIFAGLTFTAALTKLGLAIDSEEGSGAPTT
jgi:hypothetical protein